MRIDNLRRELWPERDKPVKFNQGGREVNHTNSSMRIFLLTNRIITTQ